MTSPSQRAYEEDLHGARFQRGVALTKWRLVSGEWPNPVMAITAAKRETGPDEYFFRFDLNDYAVRAPTSQIWDPIENKPLAAARRPWGSENIRIAFRTNWQPALYIPCDRVALETHPKWATKPGAWRQGHDITHYLNYVHDLLNSAGYTGMAGASAPA